MAKNRKRKSPQKSSIPQEGSPPHSSELELKEKRKETLKKIKEEVSETEEPKKRRRRRRKKEPELSPEEQEILAALSPESLSLPITWIDGGVAKATGIRSATEEEIKNLTLVWSKVAQKRLPEWLAKYSDVIMAIGITTISYGGRYLEKAKKDMEKKKEEEKPDDQSDQKK